MTKTTNVSKVPAAQSGQGGSDQRERGGESPEWPRRQPFEAGLQRLEKIVTDLERPDLPLEDSIKLFEEGMALADECRKQLDAAEGKVEILVKRAGAVTAQPFRITDTPDEP
jgi:exodeoxyribonuclease VII small subunit